MTLWKIRALTPTDALDLAGHPARLPAGRRGFMPSDTALDAAQSGAIEILAPDGLAALRTTKTGKPKKGQYKRRDAQPEPIIAASAPVTDSEPSLSD